jgi:hypothetical protein
MNYYMKFSKDFKTIESGFINCYDIKGNGKQKIEFEKDLFYKVLPV